MQAIETRYKGYHFRSRLEARWAVYWDALGLQWEYEKEGFDFGAIRYLPDFWLPEINMWAEVKQLGFNEEEMTKVELLVEMTRFSCLLLDGVPSPKNYLVVEYTEERDVISDYTNFIITYVVITAKKKDERRFWWAGGFNYSPDMIPNGYFEDVHRAYMAARSARFEFGQSGATI